MFLLHGLDLLLVLGNKTLLRGVSLIAELLDDGFDFTVALSDHFLLHLALCFDILVLRLLKNLRPQFFLFDQKFLFHLLELYRLFSLHGGDLVVAGSLLSLNLLHGPLLNITDVLFQPVILRFEHVFNARAFCKHGVLPSLAFVTELLLKSLVLFMELCLSTFSLFIESCLFLSLQLVSESLHLFFPLCVDLLLNDSSIVLVQVVCLSELFLVPLHDSLDLWLESLDGLCSNLGDLFFLPSFATDLLSSHPRLLVLLEIDAEPIFNYFTLFIHLLVLVLERFHHLLNLLTEI